MTGEPDLHPLTSDEWVTYLKQLMQHQGLWDGDTSPEFTEELADAVRALQQNYGISPADGVVHSDTWAILTGALPGPEPQPQASTDATGQPSYSEGLTPNAEAHAEQVPATFSEHGLPAFEFALPEVPLAEADFETPEFSVHVELSLTGSVKITFPGAVPGATVGNEGLSAAASHAVDHLNQTLSVGGIGTHELKVGDSLGNEYTTTGWSLGADGAMTFTGQAQVSYRVPTDQGEAEVEGTLGFAVKVQTIPHPQPEEAEPEPVQDEESWFERHSTLVTVGVIGLGVAVAIVTLGAAVPEEAAAGAAIYGAEEAGAGGMLLGGAPAM